MHRLLVLCAGANLRHSKHPRGALPDTGAKSAVRDAELWCGRRRLPRQQRSRPAVSGANAPQESVDSHQLPPARACYRGRCPHGGQRRCDSHGQRWNVQQYVHQQRGRVPGRHQQQLAGRSKRRGCRRRRADRAHSAADPLQDQELVLGLLQPVGFADGGGD
uniref:(northern house mosquito) hypothetical protein n=1 Tax=Culex pipiens TaxID=7175 RepID=A0A8D8I190_CULPI